ncbi:MAG: hypothetical protein GY774_29855 [Planctomycetes bacterium]|nr:hypothetical protein [Planctomycetota bacterium]
MDFKKYLLIVICAIAITQNVVADQVNKDTGGAFDFKNPKYNSILITNLEEPSLFSFDRYGDGGNPNPEVRILLEVDGRLVEEELPGSQGRKFSTLEGEAVTYLYGKQIKIYTKPSKFDPSYFVRGRYSNNVMDDYDLISKNWTLVTKNNENIQKTIVHLGTWEKPINIRINFNAVEVSGSNTVTIDSNFTNNDLICMIYVNGKPLVNLHDTPYIFSEGNSVDITAKSLSIGFHPSIDNAFKGRIKGTFNIREIDLIHNQLGPPDTISSHR